MIIRLVGCCAHSLTCVLLYRCLFKAWKPRFSSHLHCSSLVSSYGEIWGKDKKKSRFWCRSSHFCVANFTQSLAMPVWWGKFPRRLLRLWCRRWKAVLRQTRVHCLAPFLLTLWVLSLFWKKLFDEHVDACMPAWTKSPRNCENWYFIVCLQALMRSTERLIAIAVQ